MVNDPVTMPSMISAHIYEGKGWAFLTTTLCGLILCVFSPIPAQAVGGEANKTDAEFVAAVIGTWEEVPNKKSLRFRKAFYTFHADGNCKVIGITNNRGSPRRVEIEARWRVNRGYLIAEAMKMTPANLGIAFHLRDQIESIDDRVAKLRDEKGDKGKMRKISRLPSLPPLLASPWVPDLSAAEARRITVSTPQPDYPYDARRNRIEGRGVFKLVLTKAGEVGSIQVLKSTGSKILDDAAEKALRQWRFKPGIVQRVNVPINFVLRSSP